MKVRFLLVFALLLIHPTVSAQTPAPMRESKINSATTTSISNQENNPFGKSAAYIKQLDQNLTIIILFPLKIVALILSIFGICWIIWLIVNRPSQLIIDNFTNATGTDEIDGILSGLRQLAREYLIKEINKFDQQVKQELETQKLGKHKLKKQENEKQENEKQENEKKELETLKVETQKGETLKDSNPTTLLITLLQKLTPDPLDSTVLLLKVIFPPRGTKVASILQSQGSTHHKLGITFEISALQGKAASKIYTVWESVEYQSPPPDLKDRYRELLKPAMHLLARKLYCREMEIAASQARKSEVRDFCKYTLELDKLHDENVKHE